MKSSRFALIISVLAGLAASRSSLAQPAPDAARVLSEPRDVGRLFGAIGPIDYSVAPEPSDVPPPALLSIGPADAPNEPNFSPLQTSIGRAVTLNLDLLNLNADGSLPRLSLPVFDGSQLELVILHEERRGDTSFSWFGQIAGLPASQVLIVRDGDVIRLTVNDIDKAQRYEVRFNPAREGLPDRHVLRQFDGNPFKYGRCGTCEGGCTHSAPQTPVNPNDPSNPPVNGGGGNPYGERSDPDNRVDVLFIFTPEAATLIGNLSARRVFAQSLADSFNTMANASAINLSVRVADANTNLNENRPEGADGAANLVKLTYSRFTILSDGTLPDIGGVYDEALSWRDDIAADHVCLIRATGWNASSGGITVGVAWRPNSTVVFTRTSANSVVAAGFDNVDQIFAHELGHTFGACHDPATQGQAVCSPALTTYASGYVAQVQWPLCTTSYYDIMAYGPLPIENCLSYFVPVFSNPDIIFDPPNLPFRPDLPPRAMGNANSDVAQLMNSTRTTISAFTNASAQAFVMGSSSSAGSDGTYFNPFPLVRLASPVVVPPGTDFGTIYVEPGPYNETNNSSDLVRFTNRVRIEPTVAGSMIRLE